MVDASIEQHAQHRIICLSSMIYWTMLEQYLACLHDGADTHCYCALGDVLFTCRMHKHHTRLDTAGELQLSYWHRRLQHLCLLARTLIRAQVHHHMLPTARCHNTLLLHSAVSCLHPPKKALAASLRVIFVRVTMRVAESMAEPGSLKPVCQQAQCTSQSSDLMAAIDRRCAPSRLPALQCMLGRLH